MYVEISGQLHGVHSFLPPLCVGRAFTCWAISLVPINLILNSKIVSRSQLSQKIAFKASNKKNHIGQWMATKLLKGISSVWKIAQYYKSVFVPVTQYCISNGYCKDEKEIDSIYECLILLVNSVF